MRPTATEALRGLQAALMSDIAPEVRSAFGQDTLQTIQMLLETLAQEVDGAADDLRRDNETLAGILERAEDAVRRLDGELADDIATALGEAMENSLAISALEARCQRLRGLLERILVLCEDTLASGQDSGAMIQVRAEAFRHLGEVASRGWSFWDISSFRERMERLRAEGT